MHNEQYVYVINDGAPPTKVGITINPQERLSAVRAQHRRDLKIKRLLCVPENSDVVEAIAHWLLREHHIKGEWFSVDEDVAFDAVIDAARRSLRGETSPERIAGPGRPPLHVKETKVRLTDEQRRQIEALVGTYGMARFIRDAVDREIERRLIQSGEDARTFPASTGDADP